MGKIAFFAVKADQLPFFEKLFLRLDHAERITMRLRQRLKHRPDGSPWIPGLENKLAWAVLDHYSVDYDFPTDHFDMWKAAPTLQCKWASARVLIKVLRWLGISLKLIAAPCGSIDRVNDYRTREFWDEVRRDYEDDVDSAPWPTGMKLESEIDANKLDPAPTKRDLDDARDKRIAPW